MRYCTKCGQELKPEHEYCPACGAAAPKTVAVESPTTTPIESNQFCTSCGSQVGAGIPFCTSCGKPMAQAIVATQSASQAFCVKCGKPFVDTEPFCTTCGTARGTQTAATGPVPATPVESRATNAMIVEIAAGLFGFLGVGYLLNKRTGLGVALLLGWWVALVVMVILSVTTGVFGCLAVPIAIGVPIFSGFKLRDSIRQQGE